MFTVSVLGDELTWNDRSFVGDEALVATAQRFVADGFMVPLTPTGPRVRCKSRPEVNAWATALAVCALFDAPRPSADLWPADAVAACAVPAEVDA